MCHNIAKYYSPATVVRSLHPIPPIPPVLPRLTPLGDLAACSALCSQIEDIFLHNLKSNTSFLQEDRGCVRCICI